MYGINICTSMYVLSLKMDFNVKIYFEMKLLVFLFTKLRLCIFLYEFIITKLEKFLIYSVV